MKKTLTKILSVILIVCITLTSAPLSGLVGLELPEWLDFSIISKASTSGTCGENLTWTFDELTGTLTISGVGDMDDYEDRVPPYDPYNNTITTVVFTDGVISVGEEAFYGCDTLENVYFSESVKSIGHSAFSYCENIKEIVFPEGLKYIGMEAFNGCTGITGTVVIPKNVSNINAYAFQNCNQIESVVMYATGISPYAFHKCSNLKDLTIDKNLSAIDVCAFQYCSSIENVYYSGTQEQWNSIRDYSGNSCLFNAIIHYNSVGKMASIVAECEVGDVIEFGSYPQSEVKDEELIAKLNSLDLNWVSYEYYIDIRVVNEGRMVKSDYMKYVDVIYNGNKYRAVTFNKYRPETTIFIQSTYYTYQGPNGYYPNIIYWFKFEPIQWRVIEPDEGFVLCESIIDSQAYNDINEFHYYKGKYYQDKNHKKCINDYTTSSIRDWLNNTFYNLSFVETEKKEIQNSTQDNSEYDVTYDKIFLLSCDDAKNSKYDIFQHANVSDYAKSQGSYGAISSDGMYIENYYWWLRSPDYRSYVNVVNSKYDYFQSYSVYNTYIGVRPALKFNPKEEIPECDHNHETKITTPTCIEQGYTTYTCSVCGDTYTSDFVDALGHTDGETVEENYVAPTCTETGSKDNVTYCTVCDAETSRKEIIIDATGHTEEEILAVAPTCTENGLTAGVKCSVCGEILTAQQEILANGHKYESVVTAPTCTEQGYTTYTCACGDSYVDDYTDSLGHDFENGTCTECSATDPDYFTFEIQNPSRTTIRCNDGIKLHTSITGNLPEGSRIEWSKNNSNFNANVSDSGNEITIISKNNGYTTFTATVYDVDNNVIAQDTVEMYSKAGFFDKIGGFFRSLFGSTQIYDN